MTSVVTRKKIIGIACILLFFCFSFLVYDRYYHQFALSALNIVPWIEEFRHEREIQQQSSQESMNKVSVKVPILVYHSVRPYETEPKEVDEFDITPELFERHLAYLNDNGFTTISFDDLVDFFTKNKPLPPKCVILTFDDGWENQYIYALPLLKKYHQMATFFIFTNAINYRHFLTWKEIEDIHKSGMEIGSHTKSHPYLNKIPDETLRKEMIESKTILENHLGIRITAFASPFGYSNDAIISLIREAGYESGRTLYHGLQHSEDDLLKLKSILISDNFNEFKNIVEAE